MNNEPKLLDLPHFEDNRGSFSKVFQFEQTPIDIRESYYSYSDENVIRGMHFQLPPYDHDKIVHVISGKIVDVVLDLRRSSPNYGKFQSFDMIGNKKQALFIPKGFAHGFLSKEKSIVFYIQNSSYHQASDQGVRFDSFGFDWDVKLPIISNRDLNFLTFDKFRSPF